MGCLLLKQTLAVCLWVLCHQQLRSWGGFTATWCQTTNPGCHANLVIKILCFCLLMVPQNRDNYMKHHLTSLPACSLFIYTHLPSQSAEPGLQKALTVRGMSRGYRSIGRLQGLSFISLHLGPFPELPKGPSASLHFLVHPCSTGGPVPRDNACHYSLLPWNPLKVH